MTAITPAEKTAIVIEALRKLALQQDNKLRQALAFEKNPEEASYEPDFTSREVKASLKETLSVLRELDSKPLAFKAYKETGVKARATKTPAKTVAKAQPKRKYTKRATTATK